MPGMNSGLNADDPTLVAAFRSALLHQLGVVAAIFILLLVAYWTVRARRAAAPPRPASAEPSARRVLRIGFGMLWVVDGILQAQPRMVAGLPSQVVAPAAASSPRWVQDVVNTGGTIWSFHPVQAAAAAVWIQIGLGLWLIAAETGWSSRLAGLATVAWGLVVWMFGEAFGGIFAPGLSWLTGAPGAVLLYVAAGALIALPFWAEGLILPVTGVFFTGMAVLQAWPGRGFWQGGDSGTLTGMVQSMAQDDQPHAQSAMVSAFASFEAAHGFAVNMLAVIALGLLGLALLSGRPRLLRVAVPAAVVFCLADWALVQDFGMPGGLGTDPNTMLPWVVLLWAGYLAAVQGTQWSQRAVAPLTATRLSFAALRPAALSRAMASASARSMAALGAFGIVLVGAAPMAAASADRNADPIIATAVAGASVAADRPAPGFAGLTDQSGRPVSLVSLRGKVVLLTFLDPVCSDCQTIAGELKTADAMLGPAKDNVELVAIAAGSTHTGAMYIRAFDRLAGLTTVPNWLFLTGSVAQLQEVWTRYERVVPKMMTGMNAYSDVTFVIDGTSRIRQEVRDRPGPSTASTRSSFAVLMSGAARQVSD
jgi:cytochrome oxidase Cu insertion factor (SCO1/SenC/PrrC family)